MTTRASLAIFAAILMLTAHQGSWAQDRLALQRGVVVPSSVLMRAHAADPAPVARALERLPLWSAPIASALVPGLGQARLGNERFVAYASAEAFLVLRYLKHDRESRQNARGYRDIARDVARRNFVPNPPDTIFQYYEKMEKFLESGAFSRTPNGPTVPESDPATFNGSIWELARRQFGVPNDPGEMGSSRYQAALLYYEARAVRQPYRWSWRNAQLEQDLFRRTIARSNDASRRATLDVSAIIANHLLSAVDAFAVLRLRQLADGRLRFSASIPLP